jgi:uncharacterized protein VirK/YbjX
MLLGTARSVHPEPGCKGMLARAKYVVRGLARPRLTAEWLAIMHSRPLGSLLRQYPHILNKLQRPYLHRRLGASGRLSVLRSHYQFVSEFLDEPAREEIFAPAGLLLATLPQIEGHFTLRLFYSHFWEEGEFSIGLFDNAHRAALFTLTFCIFNSGTDDAREIFIGGLQGLRANNMRELAVTLTRSLEGLRPKALLVFAVQRLAQSWGIGGIRAVARDEHIYRHYLKRKNFDADYDEFWLQCHGVALSDGNFRLPSAPPARNIDELPRKKRPIYRRRYAMLAELGEEIAWRALGWDEDVYRAMSKPEEFDGLSERLTEADDPMTFIEGFDEVPLEEFDLLQLAPELCPVEA